MKKGALFLILILNSVPALAVDKISRVGIDTSVYTLRYPAGWSFKTIGPPIQVRGPDGEVLLITPVLPVPKDRGQKKLYSSKMNKDYWRARIKRTIDSALVDKKYRITQPYKEVAFRGMPFFSAYADVPREKAFLDIYGLIGKQGAVFLVTVEGWKKDERTAAQATVRMLKGIRWK